MWLARDIRAEAKLVRKGKVFEKNGRYFPAGVLLEGGPLGRQELVVVQRIQALSADDRFRFFRRRTLAMIASEAAEK